MRKIPFFRASFDGNELKYVREAFECGWLTTGAKAAELENKFSQLVGSRFACTVNSCTAALHLALEAIGVRPGDKVFVPSFTFTATAEVVRYLGADPVFLDVEYETASISPRILLRSLVAHPDVRYLVMVHFGGYAAEMVSTEHERGILEICRQHGIRVVEDAAHALPTRIGDDLVGSFGDVTCFSFYANKTLTTGEGGMLVTNDESVWKRAKVMRLHGIDRDVWSRYTSSRSSWEYDVVAPGYKYNMPDINAAIGLAQLEYVSERRDARERCARHYVARLSTNEHLDLITGDKDPSWHAWHLFVIVLKESAPISRNELMNRLAENGVGSSVHYKPLHRMTYYRDRYHLLPDCFPNAERIWRGCLSLPIYPGLGEDELDFICDIINASLDVL